MSPTKSTTGGAWQASPAGSSQTASGLDSILPAVKRARPLSKSVLGAVPSTMEDLGILISAGLLAVASTVAWCWLLGCEV